MKTQIALLSVYTELNEVTKGKLAKAYRLQDIFRSFDYAIPQEYMNKLLEWKKENVIESLEKAYSPCFIYCYMDNRQEFLFPLTSESEYILENVFPEMYQAVCEHFDFIN